LPAELKQRNKLSHAKATKIYLAYWQLLRKASTGVIVSGEPASTAGEHYEYTEMYPRLAETADKEGFAEIATVFRKIAIAEKRHEQRYLALAKNITDGRVFKRSQSVRWICRNCGYVHEGPEAPKVCPACTHAQGRFELEAKNY
jgi:rubrerythrin